MPRLPPLESSIRVQESRLLGETRGRCLKTYDAPIESLLSRTRCNESWNASTSRVLQLPNPLCIRSLFINFASVSRPFTFDTFLKFNKKILPILNISKFYDFINFLFLTFLFINYIVEDKYSTKFLKKRTLDYLDLIHS